MEFKIFYHDIFEKHLVPIGHPERPDRIINLNKLIKNLFPNQIQKIKSQKVIKNILKVHTQEYIKNLFSLKPENDILQIDADTYISLNSLKAAETAVCGIIQAVDFVMKTNNSKSFVCSRPPGHHAEPDKAMGFCIFSNAAIGAKYALDTYNLKKVAVLDFDVHHGNGTQSFFEKNQKNLIFASTHEMPLFPGTGYKEETGLGNIINEPIAPSLDGKSFLKIWQNKILPKIEYYNPELLILSAGFDAHKDDTISSINLKSEDYLDLTEMICKFANQNCDGRIVSILEGGYNLDALTESVKLHLQSLLSSV